MKPITIIIILWSILSLSARAQYFGQNKPVYKHFNFRLYKTPHFELYHYFTSDSLAAYYGRMAEKWYYYHQQVLLDTFHTPNPIILYSSHADFQQTSAISSTIDVGTGGVTEGMKRRVVLPVTYSTHQTDHVLGHELVHAFQYHMLEVDDNIGIQSINNIPLWMIEGMAEYLSIGNMDSQTNLWMRDALIHERFPTLKEMTFSYRYSPYRFGHAFWAFIAYRYGEQYIPRLFKATASEGYEKAIADVLMISPDSLSGLWKHTLKEHLLRSAVDSTYTIIGERLLSPKNSGRYNLNPVMSPNGRYIVFLSERDIYDIDLFLADAHTGKVTSRLYTATSHDEIDAINYLETAGSWSPDSRYFAFVAFTKGRSACMIYDVEKKSIKTEITLDELDEFSWPAWSPDGQTIAFSGLKEGQSDIYLYTPSTRTLRNITHNPYACLQPSWAPDGQSLLFTTDQNTTRQMAAATAAFNIARVRISDGYIDIYSTFEGARNLHPIATGKRGEILFLSDYDGRRNLYLYHSGNDQVFRITDYPTGITGMTDYSPALSYSGNTLCYTMMWDGAFHLLKTDYSSILKQQSIISHRHQQPVANRIVPPSAIPSQVETNLYFNRRPYAQQADSFYNARIRRRFRLDYIGNIQGGVMAGRFGAGMAGSIEAMFSDILSQNKVYTALSINGEVYDFGGQLAYIKEWKRFKMGASLSHIPYRYGTYRYETETLEDGTTETTLNYIFRRTFEDKLSLFTYLPFNKTRRVEFGLSYAFYSYRIEKLKDLNAFTRMYSGDKERLPPPPSFGTAIIDAAFVIDNAKMGLASPVEGKRLRVQVENYLHRLRMHTLLIDYRKYFLIKPYSLAFRIYHYGRYGEDSDSDRMTELFLGSPWFVRGYDSGVYYGTADLPEEARLNQLIGSRLLVSNVEWRIPFTGPRELAWIGSHFWYSELALFADGGICWTKNSRPSWHLTRTSLTQRVPVFSTGLAYRINLFGAIVVEPYYAFPYVEEQFQAGNFGLNIFAGW